MKKALGILGAVVALATAFAFAQQAPQANAANPCDGRWLYASWGRGCVYYTTAQYGQVDDIATDGYCVRAKHYDFGSRVWREISSSMSCGAPEGFAANINGDSMSCVRMYRDDGRYLTLRRARSDCP